MKFFTSASSILLLACFCCTAGCGLYVPRLFEHDEVPPEIKNAPRLVQVPPETKTEESWPRLGDVPGRPKNLTPQDVYERHVEELQQERAESEAVKREALENDPNTPPFLKPPEFQKK